MDFNFFFGFWFFFDLTGTEMRGRSEVERSMSSLVIAVESVLMGSLEVFRVSTNG